MAMTRMHNPPHLGEVLQDTVLKELTITDLARRLGVSRVANCRAGVSAELAIRLARLLGGSAESWLAMQAAHDLWRAEKRKRPRIDPMHAA
jgi:antitoxin HigA-1